MMSATFADRSESDAVQATHSSPGKGERESRGVLRVERYR